MNTRNGDVHANGELDETPQKSKKLPAFQFYPADWLKDPAVQALSWEHRAMWFHMICLMHETEQRGKLLLNGRKIPDVVLARMMGVTEADLAEAVQAILEFNVASIDQETGAICCRRMVRDESLRQTRAECGRLGGNPALLKQKATTHLKEKPTNEVKQKTTPSSSSSVASSSSSSVASSSSEAGKRTNEKEEEELLPPEIQYWNSKQELTAKVVRVTKTIERLLAERRKDPDFTKFFNQAVDRMCRSDFCLGRKPGHPSKDFTWILQSGVVIDLMNGKYGGIEPGAVDHSDGIF